MVQAKCRHFMLCKTRLRPWCLGVAMEVIRYPLMLWCESAIRIQMRWLRSGTLADPAAWSNTRGTQRQRNGPSRPMDLYASAIMAGCWKTEASSLLAAWEIGFEPAAFWSLLPRSKRLWNRCLGFRDARLL